MVTAFFRGGKRSVLIRAGALTGLIALADWRIDIDVPFGVNIPLGFLYLFPMLLVSSALARWQIALSAGVCTILTEEFDTFQWSPLSGIPRDILYFAAFFCMGLFVYEVGRSRRLAQAHVDAIEKESEARRDAEEQLKVLVDSSPLAVFASNAEGVVLFANEAADRLFGLKACALTGRSIRPYLPALVNVPPSKERSQSFRTVMQCRGRREDGEVFLADIWFSTYQTTRGARLAAMVMDTSEELRTREESSLDQLLAGSKIMVGAVSHEIRNVCGAIAMVHENLARGGTLTTNKDFEALGTLILALEKIAGMELRETANQASGVDVVSVLEELRIVVEPSLREDGIDVHWNGEVELPAVWADRQSLMQVFLNLVKNSRRAMRSRPRRTFVVTTASEHRTVLVTFEDTGGGLAYPEQLFKPFQRGAQATGLGLYLSRAFMRSFRGDLKYEPVDDGSRFIVELAVASPEGVDIYESGYPHTAGGRSRPVSGEPEPSVAGRA
jgi:two-component system sensor kinase FixL